PQQYISSINRIQHQQFSMTSSDMARHLAPLISASRSLFTPINHHPSSPSMTATIIPLEQHYSFDENLQTRTFHPQISSSPARELSWLPMMPDIEPPTSPASVSESLIDPLCSVLQAPQSPPIDQPAQGDEHFLNALYFPESGTFIGYRGFPTFRQTTQLVNAYISTLSSVKKNKSLISRQMYADIKTILRDAGNTAVGSAQFRFWARRNFELFRDTEGRVCVMHKGKPVAVREELYDVLAVCHLVCRHGGRDKTLGQVSFVPIILHIFRYPVITDWAYGLAPRMALQSPQKFDFTIYQALSDMQSDICHGRITPGIPHRHAHFVLGPRYKCPCPGPGKTAGAGLIYVAQVDRMLQNESGH
ncbi:hypothetical protein V1504DRAFT_390560, partial [Lipomyces starkeyi]